jgi:phage terminase large subunit
MRTTINLNLKKITNDIYYPLYQNQNRYLVLYGGAGAGKSHFVCQKKLVRTMKEEGHRILIVRKVARTLRRSVFQLFQDYISRWNLEKLFVKNKTDMDIRYYNGNMIYFAGIDDPEKIKSIEGITSIWIEEASELSLDDFNEINRRLRGKTKNYKQIILTYNPISVMNWTNKYFFEGKPKNFFPLRTTYKDNRFIDEEYKEILEGYTGNARTVFTLGEYGKLEHAVYSNWDLIDNFPETDKEIYGLDFGFTNPQALVKVYLKENDLYLEERLYKRKQTIPELISDLESEKTKEKLIIADSEAPATIEEIRRGGFFNIMPCKKGQGSVEEGIKFMEGLKIHITKESTNLIKEIQSYQRKVDKDGNILEAVEKSNDHLLDGARMVVFTHYYNKEEAPQVRWVGEDKVKQDEDDEDIDIDRGYGPLDDKYGQI